MQGWLKVRCPVCNAKKGRVCEHKIARQYLRAKQTNNPVVIDTTAVVLEETQGRKK
jgi:hypothetical protein